MFIGFMKLIEDYAGKGFAPNALDFLYNEKEIVKVRIVSYPQKDEKRVDAIIRQYNYFSLLHPMEYSNVVCCIEYSMLNPLIMSEKQVLRDMVGGLNHWDKMLVGTAIDNRLYGKLLMTLICSR